MATTYPIVRLNIMNQTIVFQDTDIIEAEVVQEIHPIGIEVPASTARIRVWLDDNVMDGDGLTLRDKFAPFSHGTYYQSMVAGLRVDVDVFIDSTIKNIGSFYLQEWKNPKQGELELVCVDAIGMLDNLNFLGNFYPDPMLMSKVVSDILSGAEYVVSIDPVFATTRLKGYLPGNKTVRESLQQVLFACGAYATAAENGEIQIKPAILPKPIAIYPMQLYNAADSLYDTAGIVYSEQQVRAYITDDEKTDSQELNITELVTAVEIRSHDYSKGTVVEEIFSAQLTPGDYMVVYSKPYHWVSATGIGDVVTYLATTNNEALLTPDSGTYPDCTIFTVYGEFEFGVNYVYLHVPTVSGDIPEVVVTGKPWIDSTQIFRWDNPAGVQNYSEGYLYAAVDALYNTATYQRSWQTLSQPNVWKIDDATLVPSIRTGGEQEVAGVLTKVSEYAALRYQQKVRLFPRSDINLGDVELVDSLYDKDIVGVVTRVASDLTGGYLLDIELTGTERTNV